MMDYDYQGLVYPFFFYNDSAETRLHLRRHKQPHQSDKDIFTAESIFTTV
jgi:hypothetical protein